MNNEFGSSSSKTTAMQKRSVHQPGQSAASTLVSVNLNIDFNPGGGPMPRRQRRVQMKQQQQQGVGIMGSSSSNQNRMPINMLKKNAAAPLELTLSSSKLTIPEESSQLSKTRLDNTVEPIWWPPIENSPANPNSNNPIVMDNSMSTSAAWTASTTGVMSDRSSVYSIDGDFEREASHKVNKQLKEIESILYEKMHSNQHNHNHTNINEYEEWSLKFPHLRFVSFRSNSILTSLVDLIIGFFSEFLEMLS